MELFIVRHGIAQDRDDPSVRCDAERVLTPEGVKRTRQAALGLKALGCRPQRIATSPLPRAEQTARTMAEVLCPDIPVDVCEFLALTNGGEQESLAWLRGVKEGSVMLVGHMPDVADLASSLVSDGPAIDIVFKKAAVCCISFDGTPRKAAGRLEWLLQPAQLRAIGER